MKYIKNKIFILSLTLALCVTTVLSVFYFLGIQNFECPLQERNFKYDKTSRRI